MTSQQRMYGIIGSLAALALGLCAMFWLTPGKPVERTPQEGVGDDASTAFALGERHRYQLELTTSAETSSGPMLQYSLEGEWWADVVRQTARETRLLVRVAEPRLRSELAKSGLQGRLAAAQTEFTKPLLVVLDAEGRLIGLHEQEPMEHQAGSMLRAIAAVMQFVTPPERSDAGWETSEADGVGEYRARYTERAGQVHKQKLAYTKLAKAGDFDVASAHQLKLEDSQGDYRRSASGLVTYVDFREVVRVTAGMLKGLTSTSTYRLRYLGSGAAPRRTVAKEPALSSQAVSPPFVRERAGHYSVEADRARTGGRSYAGILSELAALPSDRNADTRAMRTQRRRAFVGLAALLRQDESAVRKALEDIRKGDERSHVLWDALASAGTPVAQRALTEVIGMSQWGPGERASQMIGLSMVDSPTAETVDFLKTMVNDSRQGQQATYGLGTAVHNLRDEAPDRADALLAELQRELTQSSDEARQLDLLSALGNTAHPAARETLDAFLTAENPRLRARAAWALRTQPPGEVDATLAKLMLEDPADAVRAGAVKAAARRNPSPSLVEGVLKVLDQEPNQATKKTALFALRRFEGMDPTLAQQISGDFGL